MAEPKDLFEFVENHQKEIGALGQDVFNFLKSQQPNPYVALAALSDVVGTIIESSFQYCTDAAHLETLTQQTLEGYTNTIISAAEEVMRARFNQSFRDDGDQDDEQAIGSC